MEKKEKDKSVVESTSILPEVLKLTGKLHTLVSIQQPQLYAFMFDLKSQLTEIYLDSKVIKKLDKTFF
jgi:hypothetical protein